MGDDYLFDAHAFALGCLIRNYVIAQVNMGCTRPRRAVPGRTIRGEADFCVMDNHILEMAIVSRRWIHESIEHEQYWRSNPEASVRHLAHCVPLVVNKKWGSFEKLGTFLVLIISEVMLE